MPNPENIIPPKKGEIRNPKGKPVGTKNRSTLLKHWIEASVKVKDPSTGKEVKGTFEDKIELAIILKALKGDVQAYKEIKDTLYGKLAEKIDVKTNIFDNPETIEKAKKRLNDATK
jgi:hypothetical protein